MSKKLSNIKYRLNNPSNYEISQRLSCNRLLNKINFSNNANALSVSVGDGTWDYLILKSKPTITKLTSTDIVSNPINENDKKLLKELTNWNFKKIKAEKKLPFKNEQFDLIWHFDVIEHVNQPHLFIQDQFRVLKKGGYLIFNTPNLLRVSNIIKLCLGKLNFPLNIGSIDGIGNYIHIQEYTEWNLINMLKETGFKNIEIDHSFFGIHFLNIKFSDRPLSRFGKNLSQYLTVLAQK